MSASTRLPSVRLPRSALSILSRRCTSLGASGIDALYEAGHRAGADVLETLGPSPAALPSPEFWSRLDAEIRQAGLGSLSYRPVCRRSGAVAWRGSAEAVEPPTTGRGCHFAAGLLRGVLSHAAGRPVDVTEVRCGSDDQPCWFLFGSAETVREVRADIGALVDEGVAGIGAAGPPSTESLER
ncbi:V4R domain-containing protein [Candidatus Palauibacter sp.]|uniref:V4R domain-containing protein n=1 Tax=Candidatus Palauibacter sp. TaxID=3101350 RepID=UPI003AF27EAA